MDNITVAAVTAADFVHVFESVDFARDVAPRMTCTEADAIISMLRAVGGDAAAATWHDAHAAKDQDGDTHHRPAIYIVPTDPMDDLQCDSCQ